jgi:hypothetical protein
MSETVPKNKLVKFLEETSEITFIYTAVPTLMLALIGLLTGIILFVHNAQYQDCKTAEDMLYGFLLGQMIFYYSFALIYANLLLQLIPYLNDLSLTFALYSIYFTCNTGWSLWGIDVLTVTGCPHSVYYGMAGFTIAFTFAFDLVLIVGAAIMVIRKRLNVTPTKSIENDPSIDQPQAPNEENKEEWKEEDLEGL